MIKNFITVSYRSIFKNKLASSISIFSLFLSLTFSLVILSFTHSERNFDNFIPNLENKYRLTFDIYGSNGRNVHSATSPSPYAPFFSEQLPAIESFSRLYTQTNVMLEAPGNDMVRADRVGWSDANFIEFLGIEMLIGDSQITDPNSILISEEMAIAMFGSAADAVGESLNFNGSKRMEVQGVFLDFPDNSSVYVQTLGHIEVLQELIPWYYQNGENWGGYAYHTYFQINPGADIEKLIASFHDLYYTRFEINRDQLPDEYMGFDLINVADIHLFSDVSGDIRPHTSILRVKLLEYLALVIAIIGWINFVNLQSARIPDRLKEIGVRRCLGARVVDLRLMFFLEYLFQVLFSLVVAVALTILLLPELSVRLLNSHSIQFGLGQMSIITLLIGSVLTAVYPSIIAAQQINQALIKDQSRAKNWLRSVLLSVQLMVALFLIAFTLVIRAQIDHMKKQDPGFDPATILVIEGPVTETENDQLMAESFSRELRSLALVEEATFSTLAPGKNNGWEGNLPSRDEGEQIFQKVKLANIYPEFFKVIDAEVLAGRIPSGPQQTEDLPRVILNETAVKGYNWTPEEAIGKKVGYSADSYVVAVIKDFNTVGFQEQLSPMVFIYDHVFFQHTTNDYFLVKVNSRDILNSIMGIEKTYSRIFPGNPFKFNFSNELFEEQYKSEYGFNKLVFTFSILSIILSLTGLIGVTSYHVMLKQKEIGLRKVLGSGILQVMSIFIKKYLTISLISILIVLPIAYWHIDGWLDNFATRIELGLLSLITPALIVAAMVFVIVSLVSLKTALQNPIKVLKEE